MRLLGPCRTHAIPGSAQRQGAGRTRCVQPYAGAERKGEVAVAVPDRSVHDDRYIEGAESFRHDRRTGPDVSDQHAAYAVQPAGPDQLGEVAVDPVRGLAHLLQDQDRGLVRWRPDADLTGQQAEVAAPQPPDGRPGPEGPAGGDD